MREVKMTTNNNMTNAQATDTLQFAELPDGIVIVKVIGKGTFATSYGLTKLADRICAKCGPGKYTFIIDLEQCESMDSTFMGALAAIALRQRQDCKRLLVIINPNKHTHKLLDTLGISRFVEIRGGESQTQVEQVPETAFKEEKAAAGNKVEMLLHMLETHKKLCEVDTGNEVRFQSVLKYLQESLDREQNSSGQS